MNLWEALIIAYLIVGLVWSTYRTVRNVLEIRAVLKELKDYLPPGAPVPSPRTMSVLVTLGLLGLWARNTLLWPWSMWMCLVAP
jgi:hypothetical protein